MKIDAENLILGRLAAMAAKKALLGDKVEIINCEKAVVSGNRSYLIARYLRRKKMGTHRKGPFYFTKPDMFVKRTIRGMLPHRQHKGRVALKNIKCHIGVAHGLNKSEYHSIESANVTKLRSTRYVYVSELCKMMGGK